jgi:hypothetical protein
MRVTWALLLVTACKKNDPPPPAPLPPPPKPTPVPADAAPARPALIDLTHAMDMTIVVSSTVRNASMPPLGLADNSLDTAWNSATGQLVGAWIATEVPPGATVEQLRMTAGHTGHGPRARTTSR